jgi:MoxR-like ATPase
MPSSAAETATSPTGSPVTSPPAASGAAGRLPAGELRRQVAGYLADHPSVAFTPGQVAAGLGGRSSGAVGNALAMLAGRGHARLVADSPRRYQATTTTPAAAAAAPLASPTAPTPAPAAGGGPSASAPTAKRARARRGAPAAAADRGGCDPEAGPEAEVAGPVTRPNGLIYQPRTLSGMADVTALRRLRAAGVPALLYGPPGTGKTSVIEAAFGDLYTVAGDGDTTVADLVGEYTQTSEGRYVFVHGPLVRAMREGRPLFLDDATLVPPSVLAVVYPAMDGRREIVIKANGGEVVTAAEGFYVVAGHNPGVHGAILTDALSSRFSVQIQVSTDYDLARQLGIDSRATRVARNLATRLGKGEIGWAPQLRELLAFQKIAGVLGVEAAAANLVGIAPEADRDTVAEIVGKAFGQTLTPLALGAQLTPDTAPGRAAADGSADGGSVLTGTTFATAAPAPGAFARTA